MALAPGTRLGPYEVVAPLGAGGMGEVWKARDTRLGRDVAVKVLPDSVSGDPRALARFESEARAVAALSHPGILSIFDVGETGGVHYAVTELLEGRTLRAALEEGPLPTRRALDVAVEGAEALAAAHEKGIVHRDVKPENVFLLRSGHVKLLDFGLARQSPLPSGERETDSPTVEKLTSEGAVVGTVSYMSPEQARAQPVDFRSDQFSLGTVLYEMLSGRRPFRGSSVAETLAAIIRDEPEPLSGAAPEAVLWIVERCLAKEPSRRFASTEDLAAQLEDCLSRTPRGPGEASAGGAAGKAGSGSVPDQPTPATAVGIGPSRRRMAWLGLGIAAVLALAGGTLLLTRLTPSPGAGALKPGSLDPKRIAVAPFENRTGDASLDHVGRMTAEWVTQGLSGIGLDVVPPGEVFDVPAPQKEGASGPPRESSRQLAERTRAGIVVSGSYYIEGTKVRLQPQVADLTSGRLLGAVAPASAPRADPMPAVDEVRRRVRDLLGVRLRAQEGGLPVDTGTPPRYEAFVEVLAGGEKQGVDNKAAEAHYRKALEIDPEYAVARSMLVDSLFTSGRTAEADKELAILEARKASLEPADRYWVEVQRAMLAGRDDEALVAGRAAVRASPGNLSGIVDLGAFALNANRPAETAEVLTRSERWDLFLDSSRGWAPSYFTLLCTAYHALGRHEEELAAARRGRALFSSRGALAGAEVKALIGLGRIDEADRLVSESLLRVQFAKQAPGILKSAANELRGHGRAVEGQAMAERCATLVREKPANAVGPGDRAALATCLFEARRWGEAFPALGLAEKEGAIGDVQATGLRAVAAYRAGDLATARKLEDALQHFDRPYLYGRNLYFLAALAGHRGEKDRAVSLLREAVVQGCGGKYQGIWTQVHGAFTLFEPLRGYPPFEELIRPRG